MDNEKKSSDKFFSIISDLRKKWINSLFRKIFGFEPSYSISLKGDAEERFEILAKMHRMKRVKRALLNNQFVNTSKRILLNNRFVNLFRKNKTYN